MSMRVDMNPELSNIGDPNDMQNLLEAAYELERQLDVERGMVLRRLTDIVRSQTTFRRLNQTFGVQLEN